jgi:hypothetical protein
MGKAYMAFRISITEEAERQYDCAESGETLVVEMPDQRLLAIQALDPQEDDALMDQLLESNPRFQALVAKSKTSRRKPFAPADAGRSSGST